jgi:class 3 adenylate cyclase
MDELPTGVVTFLFTDVEGSTRLVERLGDGYRAVRAGHDVIVRTAIVDDGGRVVDTAGHGFFAVFPTPRRAACAAMRTQRELAAAHGGQVLISEATRALVADALPPGTSLQDLGVHRSRDVTRPTRSTGRATT